jgi:hypothetical protein
MSLFDRLRKNSSVVDVKTTELSPDSNGSIRQQQWR